ncbi:MAG: Trm112 family protein [Gemmatimonadota bacterium]|nr:MAG: Trm112 family protein [Gemmatimonadota bacterium]
MTGRWPSWNVFLELTDLLSCPQCGPAHGLVLLVRESVEGRVRSGWLGCPNCRRDFPVEDGVVDLRLGPESRAAELQPLSDDELALKIVALSGLAQERGILIVGERLGHAAERIAELAPELEVVFVGSKLERVTEGQGVSRILSDAQLPFAEFRVRAMAIAPGGDPELVSAAARRVAPGGRLLLFDVHPEDREAARETGLTVVAEGEGIAVAKRDLDPVFRAR